MTLEAGIAIAGSCMALVTSVVAPSIIVGRYLGAIMTTQAQHTTQIASALEGVADKGRRIEQLGIDLAGFKGETRGRLEHILTRGPGG
jgi:hypothetical protein